MTDWNNLWVSIAGKQAGPIGFGLMGLTRPPPLPYDQAIKVMKAALDRGSNFWNGAEFYGPPTANSLRLLNHYFTTYPEDSKKIVLSIKGALPLRVQITAWREFEKALTSASKFWTVRCSSTYFRLHASIYKSPSRKLSAICSTREIRRVWLQRVQCREHSTCSIELSLFSTEILSNGVAQACSELKIPLVAYSPLYRGFLTGQINKLDDIPESDSRRRFPRFQPDGFDLNLELVKEIAKRAKKTTYTMPQVAIAWVTAQTRRTNIPVIPIPGCTTVGRLKENLTQVSLDEQDLEGLSQLVEKMTVHGDRYPEPFKKDMNLSFS